MPSPEDAITLKAHYDGVDHVAREMENRWGVGRLPLLVDGELRARFERQGLRFNTALEQAWQSEFLTRDILDGVAKAAGGMERAWKALDAAAKATGAKPIDPDVWEAVLSDGSIVAVVRTNAEAGAVLREGRQLSVWTMEEVARAIELMPEMLFANDVKKAYPGERVEVDTRKRFTGLRDDPIPI